MGKALMRLRNMRISIAVPARAMFRLRSGCSDRRECERVAQVCRHQINTSITAELIQPGIRYQHTVSIVELRSAISLEDEQLQTAQLGMCEAVHRRRIRLH